MASLILPGASQFCFFSIDPGGFRILPCTCAASAPHALGLGLYLRPAEKSSGMLPSVCREGRLGAFVAIENQSWRKSMKIIQAAVLSVAALTLAVGALPATPASAKTMHHGRYTRHHRTARRHGVMHRSAMTKGATNKGTCIFIGGLISVRAAWTGGSRTGCPRGRGHRNADSPLGWTRPRRCSPLR